MTGLIIYNVKRVVTPKAGNSVMVLVFCTSYHGDKHLHKVSKIISNSFDGYRAGTTIAEITIFNIHRAKLQQ